MKLPFTLSIKFIFRLLLPGFILSIGLSPIIETILLKTNVLFSMEVCFFISIFITGWLFVCLDMPIYMAFEGRRYWPGFIRLYMEGSERRRLIKLEKIIKDYKKMDPENQSKHDRKHRNAHQQMQHFPLDQSGNYDVRYPTRLGNLICAYETYSNRIYGMDSVFYWYRIWIKLDKDLREEIDTQQALADSITYVVTALYACGVLCLLYSCLKMLAFEWIDNLLDIHLLLLFAILLFVGGYILYRKSLHIHAQFGEIFKSIFDQYRDYAYFGNIVEEVATLSSDSNLYNEPMKVKYKIVSRYLNFYKVRTSKGNVPATKFIEKNKKAP